MLNPFSLNKRAFTLIELLVVIAIIALLVSILAPALSCARAEARRASCFANLKSLAMAFNNYSSEFQDRCAAFTWESGVRNPIGTPTTPTQAAADQAVYILQTRADRPDIARITGWIPNVLYSHLVMNDYLEQRLPEKAMACPDDELRLLWQKDPRNFLSLIPDVERPDDSGNAAKRWPYSSSYQLVPAAWAADAISNGRQTTDQHGNPHYLYNSSQQPMGERKFADVNFPSDKAAWIDANDRHGCRNTESYFASPESQQPIGFFDGHVSTKKTASSNYGFRPNSPSVGSNSADPRGGAPSLIRYEPRGWEAPTATGRPAETLPGLYKWTRGGLRGRDFNGGEIDTSGW